MTTVMPKIPIPAQATTANAAGAKRPLPPKPPVAPGRLPKPPVAMPQAQQKAPVPIPSAAAFILKPEGVDGPHLAVSNETETAQSDKALAKLEALKNTKNEIKHIQELQRANLAETKEATTEEAVKEAVEEETEKSASSNALGEALTASTVNETTEEVQEETKEETKEEVKEEVKEETKTGRRGRPRKETAAKEKAETEEEEIVLKLKPVCRDYDVIEAKIFGTFNDPNWEAQKKEITEKNSEIVIESDMSIGALKGTISKISRLRSEYMIFFIKYQNNYQTLAGDNKTEGIIERVKRLCGKGNNEYERRRNAILACMQYESGGELIDLYELLEQTRERFIFFKTLMDSLEQKQRLLITMNSALLMEQKLN